MYSSRGSNNSYGQQQPYSSKSSYATQSLGGAYSGHTSAAEVQPPPYGGQYSSVYGSAAQQISPMIAKGSVAATLEGRSNYGPSIPDAPKYPINDYVSSSSRDHGQKIDQLYPDRISDYLSVDRHQYTGRHGIYLGRDAINETIDRYAESVSFGQEHQSKMYDRVDQAATLRQELLKTQTLQSASVEGGARQGDYLTARSIVHRTAQDPNVYGGRIDSDLRSLALVGGSSYTGQHNKTVLGAASHRGVDDLIYTQSSSNPGYGVSLPPGRDYGAGKGHVGSLLDSDYPSSMLARVGHPRIDDRNDDRDRHGRELERREKERKDYLHEREMDRLREHERERDRERERAKERDRQREREKERERDRARDRERERERERKEKEKDREHKHGPDLKRERTPPRLSKDRLGSSKAKDAISLRRESPRHEISHRLQSPIKEKRREYLCKIFSFSFVEAERDYLSLDKRYPRLYVSPECSKVILNWPKDNLKLSLYTPVSFEHDFVEETTSIERIESPPKQLAFDSSKPENRSTVWNAKILLMSGLSQNALVELSSEKSYVNRIPHYCNMLRFAILKKNSAFMAIGGPWDPIDGGDPAVDDSALIQTAMRYAKDMTNLDLTNCQQWNRFLEIHYDRIGKDGLFSHREITVLYVPDLSQCLPSLDSWREQWLSHKKAVYERENQQSLKREMKGEKEEDSKGKKILGQLKDGMAKTELRTKETSSSTLSANDSKKEKAVMKIKVEGKLVSKEGDVKNEMVEKKDSSANLEEKKSIVPEAHGEKTSAQVADGVKPGKKKIIKRIVKKIVASKKVATENPVNGNDDVNKQDVEGSSVLSEVDVQQDGSTADPPIKTFARKKIVKKQVKSSVEKSVSKTPVVKAVDESQIPVDEVKVNLENSNTTVVQGNISNAILKRKVVKRVPKKKVAATATDSNLCLNDKTAVIIQTNEVSSKDQNSPLPVVSDNQVKMEEKMADEKQVSGSVVKADNTKKPKNSQNNIQSKSNEKSEPKNEKVRKDNAEEDGSKNKDVKEIKRSEEPPRHPGLFLQTKGCKDSKIQSLSHSLDSLLDYRSIDTEESTFELSLFAESLYEMLQYEMGSRIFYFLQKLRAKFVTKRNERKRQREEAPKKKDEEDSSTKRVKIEEVGDSKSVKPDDDNHACKDDLMVHITEEANASIQVDEVNIEDKVDGEDIQDEVDEEDPEEDPEEDEELMDTSTPPEMTDATPLQNSSDQKLVTEAEKMDLVIAKDDATLKETSDQQETAKPDSDKTKNLDTSNKDKVVQGTSKAKKIDEKLLQAFRFFDRNRAGYVRVEDLRLVMHNLGKFLSHRDVKELVQSALLESNSGRDDRVLYDKLVKMDGI